MPLAFHLLPPVRQRDLWFGVEESIVGEGTQDRKCKETWVGGEFSWGARGERSRCRGMACAKALGKGHRNGLEGNVMRERGTAGKEGSCRAQLGYGCHSFQGWVCRDGGS